MVVFPPLATRVDPRYIAIMFPIFYICIYLLNAISHKCLVAYNINMSMNLI